MAVVFWCFRKNQTIPPENTPADSSMMNNQVIEFLKSKMFIWQFNVLLLGFILLIGGSYLTVYGAEGLARETGMSERLIGILIVSVGTGLPELFTSAVALVKGHRSMAFGNIIGSNIFNTFLILGTAGFIKPVFMNFKMLSIDLPVLLIVHCALLLIIFSSSLLKRIIPWLFIIGYITYVIFLIFFK